LASLGYQELTRVTDEGRLDRSPASPIRIVGEDLARERCDACTGATPRIGADEARELSAQLDAGWRIGENAIEREFTSKTFNAAFGLATRVALLAESQGHHPDMQVGWGRLLVRFTTHAIKGLSRNDFVMAARVDRIARVGSDSSRPGVSRLVRNDAGSRRHCVAGPHRLIGRGYWSRPRRVGITVPPRATTRCPRASYTITARATGREIPLRPLGTGRTGAATMNALPRSTHVT
jgi:4a-hydroxytetrahydrobiopterin dehydratase